MCKALRQVFYVLFFYSKSLFFVSAPSGFSVINMDVTPPPSHTTSLATHLHSYSVLYRRSKSQTDKTSTPKSNTQAKCLKQLHQAIITQLGDMHQHMILICMQSLIEPSIIHSGDRHIGKIYVHRPLFILRSSDYELDFHCK